jgi:DNA-binding transcriptional LysR family regulator
MEILELGYVCDVAEVGRFTRGARRRRVTQPAGVCFR